MGSSEDKLFIAHIKDMADFVARRGVVRTSMFLDTLQIGAAQQYLQSRKDICYRFFGGDPHCERCVLAIGTPWDDLQDDQLFPVVPLCFSFRAQDKLTHRDFLGCFMAQNIARELVGDIRVVPGRAIAFVHANAASLLSALTQIGRVGVQLQPTFNLADFVPQTRQYSGTVSSVRLDSVLAVMLQTSRTKAAELIRDRQVFVNRREQLSPSAAVSPGDSVTVRGTGKFVFCGVDHTTKKGKLAVSVTKYL